MNMLLIILLIGAAIFAIWYMGQVRMRGPMNRGGYDSYDDYDHPMDEPLLEGSNAPVGRHGRGTMRGQSGASSTFLGGYARGSGMERINVSQRIDLRKVAPVGAYMGDSAYTPARLGYGQGGSSTVAGTLSGRNAGTFKA